MMERADQIADALRMTADLREQGWARATVEIRIPKVGFYRVHVEADGDKVARPAFSTGRK